jgi:hypothetical protein
LTLLGIWYEHSFCCRLYNCFVGSGGNIPRHANCATDN